MCELTTSLIQALQELPGVIGRLQTVGKANRVLSLIFDIRRNGGYISEEDKNTIRPLLTEALESIRLSVTHVACTLRTGFEPSTLRKRSSLQFLIDDFSYTINFRKKIDEYVEVLDDVIDKYWIDEEFDSKSLSYVDFN